MRCVSTSGTVRKTSSSLMPYTTPLAPDSPTTIRINSLLQGSGSGRWPGQVLDVFGRVDRVHEVLLGKGALGELDRRQRLRAVEDHLRLHHPLLHPVVAVRTRIEVCAKSVGYH